MSDQVRHAVSYPLMPRPIPHTEFGIRKPGIRNPLAPSMEHGAASREHGAVQNILSISRTFPVDG